MLFGPDSQGNENALARRMGIIEVIWDCRYYGFWMTGGQSKRYGACTDVTGRLRGDVDPTTAHRNHIHFSLSRAGAQMRTSYWRYVWLHKPLPKLDAPAGRADRRNGSATAGPTTPRRAATARRASRGPTARAPRRRVRPPRVTRRRMTPRQTTRTGTRSSATTPTTPSESFAPPAATMAPWRARSRSAAR